MPNFRNITEKLHTVRSKSVNLFPKLLLVFHEVPNYCVSGSESLKSTLNFRDKRCSWM